MRRTLVPETLTAYSVGAFTQLESMALGSRLEMDDRGGFAALLTLSTSIGYDPVRQSTWMSGQEAAEKGRFLGRVFINENNDGVFDEADTPVPGARLIMDGQRRLDRTGDDGALLLRQLPSYRKVGIEVDRGSLSDPFLVPQTEGISVVPRPGTTASYDFALVTTGEIDGTVFRVFDAGAARPVSGAIVQLLDAEDRPVRVARSSYDGYYLFDFVPRGRYRLRIDPTQLEALGLGTPSRHTIELAGDGAILNGRDFVLVPRRAEQRAGTASE